MQYKKMSPVLLIALVCYHLGNTAVPVQGMMTSSSSSDGLDVHYARPVTVDNHGLLDQISQERRIIKHNNTIIGFTAYKESTQFVVEGELVTFPSILLNEGGSYYPEVSAFRCPYNGIYFISLNYKRLGTEIMSLSVFKNQEELLKLYNGRTENPDNIVSLSFVISCLAAELLYVQCINDGSVYGEPGVPQSTFTVVMMHQQDGALHNTFTGFTSKLSDNDEYSPGDTVMFDQVLLNEGGHFESELSRFRCPFDGIFYSSMTVSNFLYDNVEVGISNQSDVILHAENTDVENVFNTVSNGGLLECQEGQYVLVSATGDSRIPADSFLDCSFSMMQLYEQGDGTPKQLHSNFVGFTAFKRTIQSYNTGDTIEFDGILLNYGDHYQPILSRFICPFDGIYFVSMALMKNNEDPLQVDISRDTQSFLRVNETEVENPWNTVGNSGLVRCYAGQNITVVAAGTGAVYGEPIKTLSTFTVMLMYQD